MKQQTNNIGEFPAHLLPQQPEVEPGFYDGTQVSVRNDGAWKRLPPRTRYTLSWPLVESFSFEQAYAQEQRLKETGRWVVPNGGEPFTLRIEGPHIGEAEMVNPSKAGPLLPGERYLWGIVTATDNTTFAKSIWCYFGTIPVDKITEIDGVPFEIITHPPSDDSDAPLFSIMLKEAA